MRGVGDVDAKSKIQIDRYSAISKEGATVSFLDPKNTREGWKINLNGPKAWVQFDRVDFGKKRLKTVNARSASTAGGSIEIHADKPDGQLLAKIKIEKNPEWNTVQAKTRRLPTGVHNLFVIQTGSGNVDLDWLSFESYWSRPAEIFRGG